MSRSNGKEKSQEKRSYHHGDLKHSLVVVAQALVNEAGVESLTLREVARRAGVSTAAPYHHFKDKAELVHALARQSLEDLDRISEQAIRAEAGPSENLQAIGIAYVMYAVSHPSEFRLMFRPELGAAPEDFVATDAPVFRVLVSVIDDLFIAGKVSSSQDRDTFAVAAWSLVHGLAALLVDGPLRTASKDSVRVRQLAEQVTGALIAQ